MILKEGFRTEDIRQEDTTVVGTREMGELVAGKVLALPA
jgi:hypothetical protein